MLKEHERREYLKSLDQEKREHEEKRLQELKEKHRQHPKVNAPVGTHLCIHVEQQLLRGSEVFLCAGQRCSAAGGLGGDGRPRPSGVQP